MDKHSQSRSPLLFGIALLPLLVLYVLSIGPAFCLLGEGERFEGDVFRTIFAPVIWVWENGPSPMDDWLFKYILWWHESDLIQRIELGGSE